MNSAQAYQQKRRALEICQRARLTPWLSKQGESSQTFESAFSNLAYAALRDEAPQLLEHLLGFQLIEKSPDNDRAIGLFGAKLGDQVIYIPAFFIDNELKGIDIMYLPATDTCLPKTEGWINYLLQRKPIDIGRNISRQEAVQKSIRPIISQIYDMPVKMSFEIPRWLADGLPGIFSIIWRYKSPKLSVPSLVKSSADAAFQLLRIVASQPRIVKVLENHYGKNFLKSAYDVAKSYDTIFPVSLYKPDRFVKESKRNDLLEIIFPNMVTSDLSPREKLTLQHQGFLIKDAREDTSRVVYDQRVPIELQTPDENGVYDCVSLDGDLMKCVVLPSAKQGEFLVAPILFTIKGKNIYFVDRTRLVAFERPKNEYTEWLAGLPTAESTFDNLEKLNKIKNSVVFISPDGKEVIGPVNFDNSYSAKSIDKKDEADEEFSPEYVIQENGKIKFSIRFLQDCVNFTNSINSYETNTTWISFDKDIKKARWSDKAVTIPSNYKVLIGKYVYLPAGVFSNATLAVELIKSTAPIRVVSSDYDISINGRSMSPKEGLLHLIRDHGLSEKTAREVIKHSRAGVHRFRIKYAQNYPLQQTPINVPSFDPATPSQDATFGSMVPTTYAYSELLPVTGMDALTSTPQDVNAPVNTQTLDFLSRAAQTGQSEVFDSAMLGTLMNASTDSTIINEYIPNLIRGLDSIGRLLFNIRWHRQQFEQRYGARDVKQLEDSLRSTFTKLGDLVLSLKKKEIAPSPQEGLDIDLASLLQ